VADRATFAKPQQYPVGIPHVMVNGRFALRDGDPTGERPGRVVRPGRGDG
jgi:N-acyl-D-aspartate/D-glutamate deacylase